MGDNSPAVSVVRMTWTMTPHDESRQLKKVRAHYGIVGWTRADSDATDDTIVDKMNALEKALKDALFDRCDEIVAVDDGVLEVEIVEGTPDIMYNELVAAVDFIVAVEFVHESVS